MKKIFLLLTMISIGLATIAQENRCIIFGSTNIRNINVPMKELPTKTKVGNHTNLTSLNTANKTTTPHTTRWYDYSFYIDTFFASGTPSITTSLAAMSLWYDTSGHLPSVLSPDLARITLVSCGSIFQPQAAGFNDPAFFAGEMHMTTEAYSIDSINLLGIYMYNPAKLFVVDTLTIAFTQGSPDVAGDDILRGKLIDATLLSDYGLAITDSIVIALMQYDSVVNRTAGTSAYSFQILLDHNSWGDTLTNGIYSKSFKLPTAYAVSSGNMIGASITFRSGDTTFIPGDTLNEEYNRFCPLYSFAGTPTSPLFAPYIRGDYNAGQFKTLPDYANGWGGFYEPMFAWTSGAGPSDAQQSNMQFHVVCPTCTRMVDVAAVVKTIKNINAFPSPASAELSVSYMLSASSEVSIELTNTVGQVVATQNLGSATNCVATFNTSNLATGVYFYTVIANGERTTGRIAIAH